MTQRIIVPGEPRGKGRPKFARMGAHVRAYTDAKTASYENLIALAYQASGHARLEGASPLRLTVTAFMPVPASYPKRMRATVADGVRVPHGKKPDLDNIVKAALDALNGLAFQDDALVSEIRASKVYGVRPRLEIEIEQITGE